MQDRVRRWQTHDWTGTTNEHRPPAGIEPPPMLDRRHDLDQIQNH